jgi:hypothetical protein
MFATSGTHLASDTVLDAVGNESAAGSLGVQVDADAPYLSVTCPSSVLLGTPGVTAEVAARDDESGLATDPTGTPSIDTSVVGPKTVTRTATDQVEHGRTRSCTTAVRYMFSGLQQPVNVDGSSIFRLGSTVPVKMKLTDFASQPVAGAVARLELAKLTDELEGTVVEAVSTSAATTGNLFRPSGDGYIFNLSTKDLSTGTWSLRVVLDDGTVYPTHISLR